MTSRNFNNYCLQIGDNVVGDKISQIIIEKIWPDIPRPLLRIIVPVIIVGIFSLFFGLGVIAVSKSLDPNGTKLLDAQKNVSFVITVWMIFWQLLSWKRRSKGQMVLSLCLTPLFTLLLTFPFSAQGNNIYDIIRLVITNLHCSENCETTLQNAVNFPCTYFVILVSVEFCVQIILWLFNEDNK